MKITVRIADVEVCIDRPKMADYEINGGNSLWRKNLMEDSVLPMLKEATNKAKELYELRKTNML